MENYRILDRETEEKSAEIRRRIRRLQNRGCVDSIANLGVDVRGQVGASFVSLKQLASYYEADEKLAIALWCYRQREEQIMACFLLPKKINKEIIIQLLSSCHSSEIAEYFGSLFLFQFPEIHTLAAEWMNSPLPFLQTAAITAIARHLMVYKEKSLIERARFQVLIAQPFSDRYTEMVANRYRQ